MKALVKTHDQKGLGLKEIELPSLGSEDVLIRVKHASICGTDVHIYKWNEWARKEIPLETTIGHEFVGWIADKGSRVTELKIGDLVTAEGHGSCFKCLPCMQNYDHLCEKSKNIGIHKNGGFAEYVVVNQHNVIQLNELKDQDIRTLSLLDPLGNAVHCLQNFDNQHRHVLITGAGPIGLMATAILKHFKHCYVAIADYNTYRLKLAKKLGADLTIDLNQPVKAENQLKHLAQTSGFTLGLELSGSYLAFQSLVHYIAPYGRIILLGIYEKTFPINLNEIVFKGIRMKGVYGRNPQAWKESIHLLQQGLNLSPIITHEYTLDEFEPAFEKIISQEAGKVLFNIC